MVLNGGWQFFVGSCRVSAATALLLAGIMTVGSQAQETASHSTGNETQPIRPLAQDYVVLLESPSPANVFCYSPSLARCPNGRLVAAATISGPSKGYWDVAIGAAKVFVSDDHGKTWIMGEPTDSGMNECAVVELVDGRLMLNMRSYRGKNRRAVALSRDGGTTWGHSIDDPTLVEPVCQASFIRFTDTRRFWKNRLLFSNPASKARNKLTVRISYDEGKTWPLGNILNLGPAAYSSLTVYGTIPSAIFMCAARKTHTRPSPSLDSSWNG